MLKELQREFGLTYLFVAHNLGVVEHISDRVAVMYLGKIVEIASREMLFSQPMQPYTRALLSAIPSPKPGIKKERIILTGDVPSPLNPPSGCRFHPRCPWAKPDCSQLEPELRELAPGIGQLAIIRSSFCRKNVGWLDFDNERSKAIENKPTVFRCPSPTVPFPIWEGDFIWTGPRATTLF